jgi:hypothetical protein
MPLPGEDEQPRATLTPSSAVATEGKPAERLEWQSELDSAMSDLDSRLSHPRRRASDLASQPALPQLGQIDLTSELLDEIAWRVSEQMRRTQLAAAPPVVAPPAPEVTAPSSPWMPEDAVLVIRLRRPLFSWKFWRRRSRRRQSSMISLRTTG